MFIHTPFLWTSGIYIKIGQILWWYYVDEDGPPYWNCISSFMVGRIDEKFEQLFPVEKDKMRICWQALNVYPSKRECAIALRDYCQQRLEEYKVAFNDD